MNIRKASSIISLALLSIFSLSQVPPDKTNFYPPIKIPMFLSGTYGELRSNHFHSGIDIKTNGKPGYNIYSIEKGYIFRIKITEQGYGKALYVKHPNGYTSVYGHLDRFSEKIERYIKTKQYEQKSYTINVFPLPEELPIKKSEKIAVSGNTGGSLGPHLHFEIRESTQQIPLNPLKFNFKIKDSIAPKFKHVYIYNLKSNKKIKIKAYNIGKTKNYATKQIINAPSRFGIGVEVYDYLNNSNNRCGIHQISTYKNNELIYAHRISRIPFNLTRFINAVLDYDEKTNSYSNAQRLFKLPNNKLEIYNTLKNSGIVSINDSSIHNFKICAKDFYGNKSELRFSVRLDTAITEKKTVVPAKTQVMPHNRHNRFESNGLLAEFKPFSFYDTLSFFHRVTEKQNGLFSPLFTLDSIITPVHKSFDLFIKPDTIIEQLKDKYLIATLNKKNRTVSLGGNFQNGFLHARPRNLGKFFITIDTIPPKITAVNLDTKNKITAKQINFKITDNLSGIKSYKGFIDNQWILFEYDRKNNHLFYIFDGERLERNKAHDLELIITDERGNTSFYYGSFVW